MCINAQFFLYVRCCRSSPSHFQPHTENKLNISPTYTQTNMCATLEHRVTHAYDNIMFSYVCECVCVWHFHGCTLDSISAHPLRHSAASNTHRSGARACPSAETKLQHRGGSGSGSIALVSLPMRARVHVRCMHNSRLGRRLHCVCVCYKFARLFDAQCAQNASGASARRHGCTFTCTM